METETENSAEKNLEIVSKNKPVSVYSLNFSQLITDAEREYFTKRLKKRKTKLPERKASFSRAVFNWRNAFAVAAILTVGILHFAYQLSVIKTEKIQINESPAISDQLRPPAVTPESTDFEVKKIDVVVPPKSLLPVSARQTEIAPAKSPLKKKESFETKSPESRSARLRRAEKILTGI